MGRWEPNTRERLQGAALDLFSERGFDGTTVADIAERAGLTERTFFRYFADKREVMFAGAAVLEERALAAIASAPRSLGAMETVGIALEAFAEQLPDDTTYARKRYAIVEANAELRERERNKLAHLGESIAAALQARGVKETTAHLASEMAVAVFRIAFRRWLTENEGRTLLDYLRDSLEELRSVAAPRSERPKSVASRRAAG
jgi:AcrR family transcriptional regulator